MGRTFDIVFGQMVVGGFGMLVFIPPHILGRGFYRFMATLYGVLFAVVLWMTPRVFPTMGPGFSGWLFGAIALVYLALVWSRWTGLGYLLPWLSIPVGVAFLWHMAAGVRDAYGLTSIGTPILAGNFLLSSLLAGSSTTAMLFGHWYLTTPDLPTRYLRRLHGVVLGSLGLLMLSAAAMAWFDRGTLAPLGFFSFGTFAGIFFWARWLIGFGAATTAAAFTWYCLREDSTQAATGFLYLVVTFVLMGEFLSRFLLEKVRLPL